MVLPLFPPPDYIICKMENEIFTPLLEQFMTSPLVTWVSKMSFIVHFAVLLAAAEMEVGVNVVIILVL